MVNILLSDVLILLLPIVLWIVGILTKLPITVLFAGFGFIGVGWYFLGTVLPTPLAIGYGIIGIFIIIGTIYTMR